jgi:hypothetical protein
MTVDLLLKFMVGGISLLTLILTSKVVLDIYRNEQGKA